MDQFGLEADYLSAAEQANRQSNVTTMVTIGCLPGALISFLWSERIGMVWAMRQACVLWIVGCIIFLTSRAIGQVYVGRLIMGMGIGQFGVLAPVYLGEIAPQDMRGVMIGLFGMSEYLGIMTGVRRPLEPPRPRSILTSNHPVLRHLGCVNPHFGLQLETVDHPTQRANHVGGNAPRLLRVLRGESTIHV